MQPGKGIRPPEFELVLACVRWPVEADGAARIRDLASQTLDWPHLLQIVEHHQVLPLVSRSLEAYASGCVPPSSLAALKAGAVENARACFRGISELVRLTRLFREEQIDLRVLKGPPLAIAAFGDATLRGAGDLDLLISEPDIPKADRILRSEGYLRCEPATWLTPRRMRSYVAHQKDFSYDHPQNGFAIDLHWRLFRNRRLPCVTPLQEAGTAWIQVGAERIPTLPADPLLLYLCVHGALDGWLRLKWLADIGALLRQRSPGELRSSAQAAVALQVLPEFSAAILLCQQWLGFDQIPAECLDASDPMAARILRFANRLMTSNDACPERDRVPTTAWFLNEFFLHRSSRSRIELMQRSLFRPRLWHRTNLPDALFPLYALLSPFEWAGFRIRRWSRSLPSLTRSRDTTPDMRPRRNLLLRFFCLPPSDVALLVEAASMLTFFRVALQFFPVQRLTAWMSKGGWTDQAADQYPERILEREMAVRTLRRVEWAIGAVVRHAPFTFVCFPQSLTAYFMLRHRHIPSRLFYGVAREEQQLRAHTWIKVGERTVVGGESESRFTILAIFP